MRSRYLTKFPDFSLTFQDFSISLTFPGFPESGNPAYEYIYVVGDLENSAVCNLPKAYCKMPADYANGLKLYNQPDLF